MAVSLAALYYYGVSAVSSSLSLPLSLFIPSARLPQYLLSVPGISALPLSGSLSPSCSPISDPFPSPAAPVHLSGGTTTLRARYSLFPLLVPAPAVLRTRTFASAASRADRAPTCLLMIPLPRVARPSSVCACVPLPRLRCLVRTLPGRSPGRC